jgi:hypothetical protein
MSTGSRSGWRTRRGERGDGGGSGGRGALGIEGRGPAFDAALDA